MTSPPKYDLLKTTPAEQLATSGCYLVWLIRTKGHESTISEVERAVEQLAREHGSVGYLTLLETGAELIIDADIRTHMSDMVRRTTHLYFGSSLIFEEEGFRATAYRSLVTAINLASRVKHPNKVFRRVADGAQWLSQLRPDALPSAEELVALVETLREQQHDDVARSQSA